VTCLTCWNFSLVDQTKSVEKCRKADKKSVVLLMSSSMALPVRLLLCFCEVPHVPLMSVRPCDGGNLRADVGESDGGSMVPPGMNAGVVLPPQASVTRIVRRASWWTYVLRSFAYRLSLYFRCSVAFSWVSWDLFFAHFVQSATRGTRQSVRPGDRATRPRSSEWVQRPRWQSMQSRTLESRLLLARVSIPVLVGMGLAWMWVQVGVRWPMVYP